MQCKDYYKLLGLERNATQDEIKRAYRKAARQYHPDVSREADAETRFKDIGAAYEVLKDPARRAAYDGYSAQRQASGVGFEFDELFESLFGQAGGADLLPLVLSLDDAYRGGRRTVTYAARTLTVQIPPGITAGQRIRLSGQGAGGSDLYLEIAFAPHPLFRVEQRDIHLDLPITPWEAALGATVPVPTLGGRVELKLPAGSQTGRRLRLKGRGLPGEPPGDQYVTLKIMTPAAATPAAQALYQRMAQELPLNPRAALEAHMTRA